MNNEINNNKISYIYNLDMNNENYENYENYENKLSILCLKINKIYETICYNLMLKNFI